MSDFTFEQCETATFKIRISLGFEMKSSVILHEVETCDLEDVPEEKWPEYVMEELGGREAVDMHLNIDCSLDE